MAEYSRDYREDVKISKYTLDQDFIDNPEKVQYWTNELGKLKTQEGVLKTKVAYVRAQALLRAVATTPKPTADIAKAMTEVDPEVVLVEVEYDTHMSEVNTIQAVVNSLITQTSSLKHLAELYQSGFWAKPTIGRVTGQ